MGWEGSTRRLTWDLQGLNKTVEDHIMVRTDHGSSPCTKRGQSTPAVEVGRKTTKTSTCRVVESRTTDAQVQLGSEITMVITEKLTNATLNAANKTEGILLR